VRICLMIEGQEGQTWNEWLALAAACEEHGLEGLFRSDHYGSLLAPGRASLDAWATLAGLAARTTRIRLGTLVSPATFRHPSVLAKNAVTVDHISGGRVEVGLGAGWNEEEHRRHGFEFPPLGVRVERFAEQLEIVYRSFTEDEFDFRGRHYTLEGCRALPTPLQRHIVVGGGGKRGTLEPARRFADEYNTPFVGPARAAEIKALWPKTLSVMTGCILGSDRAELLDRVRGVMAGMQREGEPEAFVEESRDTWVIGTLDEARARIAEYEAAGVERMMLQHLDHADLGAVALMGSLQA
jgi:alkanesulfonate monooxygenase SsuD/methylene tetrahydromethanopterin reductase-like flavin-dependent oxidoreductase (luciferase family)